MTDETKLKIKELTPLLLWLTSWEESAGVKDLKVKRSWKSYDFDVLDELKNEGMIDGSYKAKTVYITKGGTEHAKEIEKKYLNKNHV